jgi:hypothetical protein
MKELSVEKNGLVYLLIALTLAFMIFLMYGISTATGSLNALWLFFVPLGIILLIVFLVQKLKARIER